MARINTHYLELPGDYLFSEIAKRVRAYAAEHPEVRLIRLGIGDVTNPLPSPVVDALRRAVDEQATFEGFRGYGPEQGYPFLREAIANDCYRGLGIDADEIFISDGAKSDIGNFQELFSTDCRVAITDPVYPVYVDSNIMAGRGGLPNGLRADAKTGGAPSLIPLPCTVENNFVPALPEERPDIIYLCYPNNPTGSVLTKEQLALWVDYARENECVIFFDAAYEAFVRTRGIPRSIYEIEGAHEVAVEFRSYSKWACFTGLRCGFTVTPKSLRGYAPAPGNGRGQYVGLRQLWSRRQATKYNGCPYIIQRAAEAVHSPEGQRETQALINGYLGNAELIRQCFQSLGLQVSGGVDAPYVWVKLPNSMNSWAFFDLLLREAGIVGTPGSGFGHAGQGYFRLTGFGGEKSTREAVERLQNLRL